MKEHAFYAPQTANHVMKTPKSVPNVSKPSSQLPANVPPAQPPTAQPATQPLPNVLNVLQTSPSPPKDTA